MTYLSPLRIREFIMLKGRLWLLVAIVLGWANVIDTQEQRQVGILSGGFAESTPSSTEARQPRTSVPNLRQILQDLGWTEGRNIRFEER